MDENRSSLTEAFVGLFAQNQYDIHTFILTLVPNWADADDVMQATSIVLWRKFPQFQPGTNFAAWACQIARLEVQNFRRTKGRDRLFFNAALLESLADLRLSMGEELEAEREFLAECVRRLGWDDQELIRRCYGQKTVTAKQVAGELGRPVNTVYKALIRIRRKLYECIRHANKAKGGP
jgi:RNA polymerase sigma-70 factor (ECF subfamily)